MLLEHYRINGMYKSHDEYEIIAATLHDVNKMLGAEFNSRSLRLTLNRVRRRLLREGVGFLTKTLPSIGKAFDKALAGQAPFNSANLRIKTRECSELPIFMGELFERVLSSDGRPLPQPCTQSVRALRQVLYLFYKYELPYSEALEQRVILQFLETEEDLTAITQGLDELRVQCDGIPPTARNRHLVDTRAGVVRDARILLSKVFASFDGYDIRPRHGPGAVASKQRLWDKYVWTNVASKITNVWPFDAYFCASLGHVCDSYPTFSKVGERILPARVILVPKDSRGPRLISSEPVDFQWIQQGLRDPIVKLVESHPLTREHVHFTDQQPNQFGALLGSSTGRYATLDLKEASDRVSVALVRLLFPPHVYTWLEAARSESTELPDGRTITLKKFAPMGSSLCFPIMALTIWAILTAGTRDTYTRERILVYGDDVIVPTAYAVDAIKQLESFGLKVNRDKSCTSGLFRESCGVDAFNGANVTPVKLKTVWSSKPLPEVYSSWIAYANSFWDRGFYETYNVIVRRLSAIYGSIPGDDMELPCPSLREAPKHGTPIPRRTNRGYQTQEWRVWDVVSPKVNHTLPGWLMLLRYFVEAESLPSMFTEDDLWSFDQKEPFSVRSYTRRGTSMLVKRWVSRKRMDNPDGSINAVAWKRGVR